VFSQILLPGWDCTTCTAQKKIERGCTNTPRIPQEVDGETLTRCPMRSYFESPTSYMQIFEIYSWYKKGMLPEQGTYLDQAAAFVDIVRVIDKAVADANALKEKIERGKQTNKPPTVVRNGKS
jgi:hypothetical protein